VISNPTPCRIVLYHFTVTSGDVNYKPVHLSRPAVVTSVGASDDVVNLFVFFEPGDQYYDPHHSPSPHQSNIRPFNPASPQTPGWSWPPRT
jgi:hypothetical protein